LKSLILDRVILCLTLSRIRLFTVVTDCYLGTEFLKLSLKIIFQIYRLQKVKRQTPHLGDV